MSMTGLLSVAFLTNAMLSGRQSDILLHKKAHFASDMPTTTFEMAQRFTCRPNTLSKQKERRRWTGPRLKKIPVSNCYGRGTLLGEASPVMPSHAINWLDGRGCVVD